MIDSNKPVSCDIPEFVLAVKSNAIEGIDSITLDGCTFVLNKETEEEGFKTADWGVELLIYGTNKSRRKNEAHKFEKITWWGIRYVNRTNLHCHQRVKHVYQYG